MNDVNNKNNGQPEQGNNPVGGKGGPNRNRNHLIMLGISLAIFIFLMWVIFKVFIEFVTILLLFYVLVFWL